MAAACGPGPHAPVLRDLRCRQGPDACQSETDPFLIEVEVTVSDPDGDLFGGTLQRYLDGDPLGDREPLDALLRGGGLVPGSREGSFPVDLPLELHDMHDGMRVWIALDLSDAAGHESNRPGLELELALH